MQENKQQELTDNAIQFMNKGDVKAGRRFYHKDDHFSSEFAFRKQFGRQLVVKKYNGHTVGLITEVTEFDFTISYWLFNQELAVKIPFTELIIIEPKSK